MRHVIFNQKSGVGKSTLTCNLAAVSVWQGLKTLVVDLDPQDNSTRYLLGEAANEPLVNVTELFEQTLKFLARPKPTAECIYETRFEGLHLMPSSPGFEKMQSKLDPRHKLTLELVALHDALPCK